MAKAVPARLALDEDVRPLLARLLRDRGWEAISVVDAGRTGLADDDHAGMFLVRQGPLEWILRQILKALAQRPNVVDWRNQVVWASSGR